MGLPSLIHAAPALLVKIAYESDSKERIIGYASGLTFRVSQGQKEIYVVDSPFPAEIAQAASQSAVKGSMSIFLPKGQTPESLGLVPHRVLNKSGDIASMAASKYFHLRVYDRLSTELVFSADFCKVGEYSVSIQARQVVRCELSFTGLYMTPGNAR
jgi:hypothetical protein